MERNLLVIIKDYFLSERHKLISKEELYMDGHDRRRLNFLDGSLHDVEEASLIDMETRRREPTR